MHYSFDFDYTLADSSGGTIACASHALDVLGCPIASEDEIRKTIGLSLENTFAMLNGNRDDPELVAGFKKHFLEKADVVMLDHIRFFESAPKVLSNLKRDGHFVSVVSTKFRTRLERALERDGLAGFVDHIVGGDDVSQNKPHPEGLLKAIDVSNLPTTETIYVGDSEIDGECAQQAGVKFIGVTTGTTTRAALEKWSPQMILADLMGLT